MAAKLSLLSSVIASGSLPRALLLWTPLRLEVLTTRKNLPVLLNLIVSLVGPPRLVDGWVGL